MPTSTLAKGNGGHEQMILVEWIFMTEHVAT
jgi:hypothetical protein